MAVVDRILTRTAPGARWVLFLSSGRLVEVWVEPEDRPALLGGVALARVIAKQPGLGALVVRLPGGEAFVRDAGGVEVGAALPVEVVREAVGAKRSVARRRIELVDGPLILTPLQPGLGLSGRIGGKARRAAIKAALVQTLPADLGLLVRHHPEPEAPEVLAQRAERLVARWRAVEQRAAAVSAPAWLVEPPDIAVLARSHAPEAEVVGDPDGTLFDAQEPAIAAALARRQGLPGGGALVVDETEAATLIDVDLPDAKGGAALTAAVTDSAIRAASLMRLRGLRGTVLLDLPRLSGGRDRQAVERAFTEAAGADPTPTRALGWTPGGMLELIREGARPSLAEILCEPAPSDPVPLPRTAAWRALDTLLRALRRAGGVPPRPALVVDEEVAAWLRGPGAPLMDAMRRRLGALTLRADPSCPRTEHRIEAAAPADEGARHGGSA